MYKIKKMILISMLSAIAAILMILDFPILIAPSFMKIDLSEVPVMISAFLLGPLSGILTVVLKIFLKQIMKPTSTFFIGEIANLISSITFVLPASLIYRNNKTMRAAIFSLVFGIFSSSIISTLMNAFFLFPIYINNLGYGENTIINMFKQINPYFDNMFKIMLFSVFPFNLIKYFIVSIVIFVFYKKISKILRRIYDE